MFDYFNLTLPCKEECPIELYEPVSCTLNTQKRIIDIHMRIKLINPQMKIMKATPFTLLTAESDEKVCFKDYNGPKRIIFDQEKNCIVPLPNEIDVESKVTLPLKTSKCITRENLENTNHWSLPKCYNKPSIKESTKIQIHYTGNKNFVYCPGQTVKLFGSTYPCPDYVFSLSSNLSFVVDDIAYMAGDITIERNYAFSQDLSFQVNLLMHEANFSYIRQEITEAEKESAQVDSIFPKIAVSTEVSISSLAWKLLESTVTVTIVILAIKHGKRYLTCKRGRPTRVENEGMQEASVPLATRNEPERPPPRVPNSPRSTGNSRRAT